MHSSHLHGIGLAPCLMHAAFRPADAYGTDETILQAPAQLESTWLGHHNPRPSLTGQEYKWGSRYMASQLSQDKANQVHIKV